MKKAMLARPVPGLAAFLQAHFQASLKMVHQNLRSIRFANVQHWPGPAADDGSRMPDVRWQMSEDYPSA
jgi:hypothetical protein